MNDTKDSNIEATTTSDPADADTNTNTNTNTVSGAATPPVAPAPNDPGSTDATWLVPPATANDDSNHARSDAPPRMGSSSTPPLNQAPPARVLQRKNGKIAGIAGGIADYFSVDVTVVRLAIVALTLLTGPGMLAAYLIGWIVIPPEDGR